MRLAVSAAGLVALVSAQGMPQGYGPQANSTMPAPVYTTEVVTSFTTYCPSSTMITHGGVTYTVTEATTLTITNCPCTVTKPVYSAVSSSCSTCMAPMPPMAPTTYPAAPKPSSPAAPVQPPAATTQPASPAQPPAQPYQPSSPAQQQPPAPYMPPMNSTIPVAPAPVGTGAMPPSSSGTSPPVPYQGAANKASFGVAGLLAALGLVAAL